MVGLAKAHPNNKLYRLIINPYHCDLVSDPAPFSYAEMGISGSTMVMGTSRDATKQRFYTLKSLIRGYKQMNILAWFLGAMVMIMNIVTLLK